MLNENAQTKATNAKTVNVERWGWYSIGINVQESLRGKVPLYVFRDAGIELEETDASTLDEAIRAMRETER